MKSASHKPGPNSQKTPSNVYHIGGIPVEFPYQPYGTQLAFMGRVISTLDRAHREGHCHALLESPTGTGKSLSLLCSTLAWQKHRGPSHVQSLNGPSGKPEPRARSDPLNHGGGFVPESQPSGTAVPDPTSSTSGTTKQKKAVPTIFYVSRTHSQISQVIREYRKTAYRVPMCVLASRKHYCTNPSLQGRENIDEECKLLLDNREFGCLEFKNYNKVVHHSSIQKGGCNEAHDIEDLVKVGQAVKGCSYFAAIYMAEDAQLVFCPYNYIISPMIRRAMDIDIRGAIIILDEAHNIEDIAREAGSVEVDEDSLLKLQAELGQICIADEMIYKPLYEMIQDMISWMDSRKSILEKRDFEHYFSCWTGEKAVRELEEANISQQCFSILQGCAAKAIKAASDAELGLVHLSGRSVTVLEGLFSSLGYFFFGNGVHLHDYQLVLQRFVKREAGNPSGSWAYTLSLWCLHPSVIFRGIVDQSLSVLLTSGPLGLLLSSATAFLCDPRTLSPMNSFSSELGVQFGTNLEAPHVIETDFQVRAAVISNGPGGYPLNASYKTADAYAFQDAVGQTIEEIFRIVPAGCLVFFPSYKLLDKLCSRWRETGQWSRLNARKSLFVETRGGSPDEFEKVLKGYYDCIRKKNKAGNGRRRKIKEMDSDSCSLSNPLEKSKEGAAFLAVCRGKVSEGIDFSDENARAVIIVGIPFPNINDVQVAQKKKFNDVYRHSKNLLSGNEWYCQQAFRALNQAAGRCIRHKLDYGAIIFLDERFREERNTMYISKWLRKSIKQYDNYETPLEELRSFFRDIKDQIGCMNIQLHPHIKSENSPPDNCDKRSLKKKNQKSYQSVERILNVISNQGDSQWQHLNMKGNAFSLSRSHGNQVLASTPISVDSNSNIETIDLEGNIEEDFRFSEACFPEYCEDTEVSVVRETPGMNDSLAHSPGSLSKDDNSSLSIIHSPTKLLHTVYSVQSPAVACSLVETPKSNISRNSDQMTPEIDSSLASSVNSHALKRRKPLHCSLLTLNHVKPEPVVAEKLKPNVLDQSRVAENGKSCLTAVPLLDQRLRIFCSVCSSPLGLPENHFFVPCSSASSPKATLASIYKQNMQRVAMTLSHGVAVLVVDSASINKLLYNRSGKDIPGQGIWSSDDGCVYNTIFCPFCSIPSSCLGVLVMAVDASNFPLINKILFFYDCLKFSNAKVTTAQVNTVKDSSRVKAIVDASSIEKYAYDSQCQSSRGWRTTKTKLRLPKRALLRDTEDE